MEKIGVVSGIYIRNEKGQPMQSLEVADVLSTGIEGDAYSVGNGFWQEVDSKKPPEKRKIRDISIQFDEDRKKGNIATGVNFEQQDTRRNLHISGPENAQQYIDRTLIIGEVQIDLTGDCNSCNRPSEFLENKPNFAKTGKLGGVRGKAKEGKTGPIKVGDNVFVV